MAEVENAGGADLPGGGDEGVDAEVEAAREDGAGGEGQRGDDEDEEAEQPLRSGPRSDVLPVAEVQRGPQQDKHAGRAQQRAEPAAQVQAFRRREARFR